MKTFDPATVRNATRVRSDRTTKQAAFIVEALVLLVFILGSMAVLMQMFATARATGIEAHNLSQAIVLASNRAEEFSGAPATGDTESFFAEYDGKLEAAGESDEDAFRVTCDVSSEQRGGGTLYRAEIAIERHGNVLYELSSACYRSGDAGEGTVS